ncbi:MAG: hypothetical protein PHT07_15340 [Paludibacter sp.]|nr:hypothetical protein [Paludibacter sp.]
MVTIRRNEKLNGLEVAFDKKPSEAVLTYLKDNRFRWSKPSKVWYKTYSQSLEKQIRDYFKDATVESAETPAPDTGRIRRRISMDEYLKAKRGPRKDVIIGEIEAGKMEYATYKYFDGMDDSNRYNTVTNESFKPAEEAMRTYNNGNTVNFIIEDLKDAIGRAHYIYSAHVAKNDELGYYIVFDDYYIRYKDEKPKSVPVSISEEEEAKRFDEKERAIFGYHFNFKYPNKEGSELMDQLIDTYNFEIVKPEKDQSTNVLKFNFGEVKYLIFDNSGEFKMDNITQKKYMAGQTDFKEDKGNLKTIKQLASEIYEIVQADLNEYLSGTAAQSANKEPEKPYELQPGDKVRVNETYLGVTIDTEGEVVETHILDNEWVAKVFLGKNQSGQKLERNIPFGYLEKISKSSTGITIGHVFKSPTYWFYVYDIDENYDPSQIKLMQIWAYGFDKDLGRFGLVNKDYRANEAWHKSVKQSTIKELKAFISGLKWYIENTYQEMYGGKELTEKQKRKLLEDSNDEIMMWIYSEIQTREIETKVFEKGDEQKHEPADEERKLYGYKFNFHKGDKEAYELMKALGAYGIKKMSTKPDFINGIEFDYSGNRFLLFDNSGEFKIDNLTTGDYMGVIYFRDDNDALKTIGVLALEIYQAINEDLEDVKKPEAPKEPVPGPDAVEIAKAKAQALIMILKLKNKNKEIPGSPQVIPEAKREIQAPESLMSEFPSYKSEQDFKDTYGVYADSLAEKYNEMVSDIKTSDINQAYTRLTGKEIRRPEYNQFANDFLNELARTGFKLKKPIELESGKLSVYARPIKPINKSGIQSLAYFVATKDSDSGKSRPALTGVFIDNGKMVACDAYQLVIIPGDPNDPNNGKVIDPGTGKPINSAYPNYKSVIPEYTDKTSPITIDSLIEIANSAVISFKNIEDPTPVMILDFDEMDMAVNPIFLLNILQVLKSTGSKIITFEFSEPSRPLLIRPDNDAFALLMPIEIGDRLVVTERVPIKFLKKLTKETIVIPAPKIPESQQSIEPVRSATAYPTFDEFKAKRPKEVKVQVVSHTGKPESVTYTYKYYKYADRFGWYNRSGSKHISDLEAYDQYIFNMKSPPEGPSFADKVKQAAESVGATVTYSEGGIIGKEENSKNTIKKYFWTVNIHYTDSTDERYYGYNEDSARKTFDDIDDDDNNSKYQSADVLLERREDTLLFTGELGDGETLDDYPVEDDYYLKKYYDRIETGNDPEIIDQKEIVSYEETSRSLTDIIMDWLYYDYDRDKFASYSNIILGEDKEGDEKLMQIRVKDHSENPTNKGTFSSADYYLSIVIANRNQTATKFHSSTELYFEGDDETEDVKQQIFDYIQDIIDSSDIIKLNEKILKAGHTLSISNEKYAEGGMIQSGRTLFDSIDSTKMKFEEGGRIPVSKEWMGFYQKLKATNKRNIRTFSESMGVMNQYNEPIIRYLLKKNVPLIVISHEELRNKIMFKLNPPPESAIFYAVLMRLPGSSKEIVNIFLSVMPNSMIGLGGWAISLGISLKEAMETTFVHECIHAYLMKESIYDSNTFLKRLDLMRSEMDDYVRANDDQFSRIQKTANRIISDPKSDVSEIITYSFTWTKIHDMLAKVPLKSGKTVWQELLNTVAEWDKNGILIIYASKYGDVPPLTLVMAQAKYKVYQSKLEPIMLGEGGLIHGPSHENGGVDFIVKQTGQPVELEGLEAVIKKKVVLSKRKYNFNGKKATPKQILNKLNTDGGGNPIE